MAGVVSAEAAGPTLLAATQAITAFSTFLPPISEVRRSSGDPEFAADVRMGEVAAVLLTVGVGVVASSIVGTAVPLAISVFSAVLLVVLYETALNNKPFSPFPVSESSNV